MITRNKTFRLTQDEVIISMKGKFLPFMQKSVKESITVVACIPVEPFRTALRCNHHYQEMYVPSFHANKCKSKTSIALITVVGRPMHLFPTLKKEAFA